MPVSQERSNVHQIAESEMKPENTCSVYLYQSRDLLLKNLKYLYRVSFTYPGYHSRCVPKFRAAFPKWERRANRMLLSTIIYLAPYIIGPKTLQPQKSFLQYCTFLSAVKSFILPNDIETDISTHRNFTIFTLRCTACYCSSVLTNPKV